MKRIGKGLLALLLTAAMLMGNMGTASYAVENDGSDKDNKEALNITADIVGYSDARVEPVDLSEVMSMTEIVKLPEESKPEKVKISTAAELDLFENLVYSYAGKTVYLANDIDATGCSLKPVGTSKVPFQGTFDGQGYEVKNIAMVEKTNNGAGFFGYVLGGTIQNLILQGQISTTKSQAGGFVGNVGKGVKTTIDNCYSKMDIINGVQYIGGIVGMITNDGNKSLVTHEIKNCTVAGNKTGISGTKNVGGIVGGALNAVYIRNCRNAAAIHADSDTAATGCGGIVGVCKNWTSTIDRCINNGKITGKNCKVSGIAGYIESTKCNMKGCINYDDTANPFYAVKSGSTVIEETANVSKAGEDDAAKDTALAGDTMIDGTAQNDTANQDAGYADSKVELVDLTNVVRFSKYNGEKAVKIATPSELIAFANGMKTYNGYQGVTIYLATDLDMTDQEFASIGGQASEGDTIPFKGTFDGQGYQIDHLVIDGGNTQCVGLFGNLQGATVKNLILAEHCSISGGTNRIGGIAGMISGDSGQSSTIDNCWNKANISGTNFVAGIAGYVYVTGSGCLLSDGSKQTAGGATAAAAATTHVIRNCTNTGKIIASDRDAAGIVGLSQVGLEVTSCRNAGDVTANGGADNRGAGGIIGRASGVAVKVSDSVNSSNVTTKACTIGGIVGNLSVAGSAITGCRNYGVLTKADSVVSGNALYGFQTTDPRAAVSGNIDRTGETDPALETLENRDEDIKGEPVIDEELYGLVGYSDANVKFKENMAAVMSFTDYLADDACRPTEIKISNAQELSLFSMTRESFAGVTIYLASDIDMTGYPFYAIGGTVSEGYTIPFKGTFDGQGYQVDHATITSNNKDCVGFFGNLQGATVKNLILGEHCKVSGGKNRVAGIAGMISGDSGQSTTITNCWNKASIEGASFVGGIVGFVFVTGQGCLLSDGTIQTSNGATAAAKVTTHYISNCTNTGKVTASGRDVGGILGNSQSLLEVTNCRNAGEITAKSGAASQGAGGIAGRVSANPAVISGCINNGPVSAKECTVAGIVGNVVASGTAIENCGNYGKITTGAEKTPNAIYGSSTNVSVQSRANKGTTEQAEDKTLEKAMEADAAIGGTIIRVPVHHVPIDANLTGYSDARVARKDLTNVMSFTEYQKTSGAGKPKETKIATAAELSAFSISRDNYAGVTIYLATDIDMSGHAFYPVGGGVSEGSTIPFRGTFDGQGYEITNLSISAGNTDNVGFFGNLQGATIKNLILGASCTISGGKNRTGGITGAITGDSRQSTTIDNCWNKARVQGTNFAGGIVGFVYVTGEKCPLTNGTKQTAAGVKEAAAATTHYISNCSNTGTISAGRDVGGVVGYANVKVEVTNCRNAGNITASAGEKSQGCGGVVGRISSSDSQVTGCVNNGNVTSKVCTSGGIVGNVRGTNTVIRYSANYGKVANATDFITTAIYGTDNKKTAAEAKNLGVTVENEDYTLKTALRADSLIWGAKIADSGSKGAVVGYSDSLVVRKDLSNVPSIMDYIKANRVTRPTEVKISTAAELSAFGSYIGKFEGVTIYLANDIDMTGYSYTSVGGEKPEGSTTPFKGTFDGQGYEVDHLTIKADNAQNVGFFGNLQGATVKNLILGKNCKISGGTNRIGGIAGAITGDSGQSTTITNCWNKASVSGNNFVGGIVGFVYVTGAKCKLSDGKKQTADGAKAAAAKTTHSISNCTNTGNITGEVTKGNEAKTGRDIGGIIGSAQTGLQLTNCRNTGAITAKGGDKTQGCGGIVGKLANNPATISSCINNGYVQSDACTVAGIAGNVRVAGVTIKNSANHGTITPVKGYTEVAIFASDTYKTVAEENTRGVTVETTDTTLAASLAADRRISAKAPVDEGNPEKIVGYSDTRVEQVDLTNIPSFTEYMNASEGKKPKKVKITTPEELSAFSTYGDTYEDMTIYLGNDIDMAGTRFYSIGGEVSEAGTTPFKGIFDGQGYEIDNLTVVGNDFDNVGFFGNLCGATVKNLIIGENSSFTEGKNRVGGIAGMISGESGETSIIENCWNKAEISGSAFVGGIVGFVFVTNKGTRLPNGKLQTQDGATNAAQETTHIVRNCTNTGEVSAVATVDDPVKTGRDVGGIVGISQTDLIIMNCRNVGTVTADGGEAGYGCGGILGRLARFPSSLVYCINNGDVHSETCTSGGLVGNNLIVNGLIINSSNYGEITGLANAIYGTSNEKKAIAIDNFGTTERAEDPTLEEALLADNLIHGHELEKTSAKKSVTTEASTNWSKLVAIIVTSLLLLAGILIIVILLRKKKHQEEAKK